MFGKVYIYSNTHPLIWSQIYPPSQKLSHKHPVFEGQISSKKNAEKSREFALRRDTTFSLSLKKNRLRRRPPAALQGFGIRMTVQNLFTTTSSKTCTEHVHDLSQAVPSNVCTEVRAQSWYKVHSYELVNPTFKISLPDVSSLALTEKSLQNSPFRIVANNGNGALRHIISRVCFCNLE